MRHPPSLPSLAAGVAEELLAALQAARSHEVGTATEDLHRLRVAARRGRALLSLSRESLAEADWRPLQQALRGLLRATGPTRDWQVLVAETLPALLPSPSSDAGLALLAAARQREQAQQRRSARVLGGDGSLPLLLALERYLLACARAARESADPEPAYARVLRRQHRRLRQRARQLDRDDPEALHGLRLRLKAQRYRVELLARGDPGKAAQRYLARLKRLQDQLGQLHDLQVAEQRLRSLRDRSVAARALGRQLAQECARRAQQQMAGLKGLRLHGGGFRPFWD